MARLSPKVVVVAMMAVMACEPMAPGPTAPTAPEPQATCDDSAIRLLERGAGIHGAIVDDTLHLGGETAPATCTDPTNEALQSGLSMPDVWTAQVQQSVYYRIVIRYPDGHQLYVVSRRSDGTICMVDLDDECIARVTGLPDDFDLDGLPDDVDPTIPAGRPVAPPSVSPPPPGDERPTIYYSMEPGVNPPPWIWGTHDLGLKVGTRHELVGATWIFRSGEFLLRQHNLPGRPLFDLGSQDAVIIVYEVSDSEYVIAFPPDLAAFGERYVFTRVEGSSPTLTFRYPSESPKARLTLGPPQQWSGACNTDLYRYKDNCAKTNIHARAYLPSYGVLARVMPTVSVSYPPSDIFTVSEPLPTTDDEPGLWAGAVRLTWEADATLEGCYVVTVYAKAGDHTVTDTIVHHFSDGDTCPD